MNFLKRVSSIVKAGLIGLSILGVLMSCGELESNVKAQIISHDPLYEKVENDELTQEELESVKLSDFEFTVEMRETKKNCEVRRIKADVKFDLCGGPDPSNIICGPFVQTIRHSSIGKGATVTKIYNFNAQTGFEFGRISDVSIVGSSLEWDFTSECHSSNNPPF